MSIWLELVIIIGVFAVAVVILAFILMLIHRKWFERYKRQKWAENEARWDYIAKHGKEPPK